MKTTLLTDPSLDNIDRKIGFFIILCVLIGLVLAAFVPLNDDEQYLRTRTRTTRTMRIVRGNRISSRRKAA
jgi:type IV secretory pathway component VirB8